MVMAGGGIVGVGGGFFAGWEGRVRTGFTSRLARGGGPGNWRKIFTGAAVMMMVVTVVFGSAQVFGPHHQEKGDGQHGTEHQQNIAQNKTGAFPQR